MRPAVCLLFYRALGESAWESAVDGARSAICRDTAAHARAAGFERVVLVTPQPERFAGTPGLEIDVDGGDAAFGARLREAVARHVPAGADVCYAGAGLPAFGADAWAGLRERLAAGETVANNLYSSDLIATPQRDALTCLPDAASDNGVGLFLRDRGVEVAALPRSAAALLDVDTPTDLHILAACDAAGSVRLGPDLRAWLAGFDAGPSAGRLGRACDLFTERGTQVLVIGRVGSAVWQALESETACRVRVVSEERGWRTRGDEARSLLGFHLAAVGPAGLIEALTELADAVFLDTRPLIGHLGWRPTRADRFASDAGEPDAVTHDGLRELTAAAGAARAPVVLGGHSLVSGGLLALIDAAWSRWEARDGSREREV